VWIHFDFGFRGFTPPAPDKECFSQVMTHDILILGGARTAMTEYNGKFRGLTEIELGGHAALAALERSNVPARSVDHTVMGNALQTSGNAIYGARHVALKAGIPETSPALTVNRLCGSGIQAIVSCAHLIGADEAEICLAGGMENMSQAPHVVRGARKGFRLGEGSLEDALTVALTDNYCGLMMAETAEILAKEKGISRQACDEYSVRSQQAAEAAFVAGKFDDEIVSVEVMDRRKSIHVTLDDHRRPDSTIDRLAHLPPAFERGELVTAGNASGIVDGAAAIVVASGSTASRSSLHAIGRIISWGYAGVDPRIMGIGPVPSIRSALARAGLRLDEIDLFEINEAFAAQYLAVEKELGLERERVNVNGGAIALGHPLAATGTRLVLTLLLELRRRKARYGVASACIGGGQGIAMIVEAIQ
jgi:acetyl-CoA acetyltransferase family protein